MASVAVIFSSWPSAPASIARVKAPAPSVEWAGFGGNAQHTAVAVTPPQPFTRIRWKTKVDLVPVSKNEVLGIHYGSPMITAANTVLVPTRVSVKAGYRVVAYSGTNGAKRWSLNTDWRPSPRDPGFIPPRPAVLTPSASLAVAGAGGTILMRSHANQAKAPASRLLFYGAAQWKAHKSIYANAVQITTPITAPSVTVPSVATTLGLWNSSPPAKTYTPAVRASWTTACAALATAGMSSSGMWSIAWASNEIRYRGI